jgi:hypothetical protein
MVPVDLGGVFASLAHLRQMLLDPLKCSDDGAGAPVG